MENLFKENTIVFMNFNNPNPIIYDLLIYSKDEIIQEINSLYDANSPINIFGNIDGKDFFRTNYKQAYDLLSLVEEDNDELKKYINWSEVLENFQEKFEDEIYDFDFDDFDFNEFTYYFNPDDTYDENDDLTESGWENISENFIEILHNVIENFPIVIVSESIQDFDEYEYNETLRIRFEIHPFVENSKRF